MLELAPIALLTAALVVWITQQRPPGPALAFAGAPITDDILAPPPVEEEKEWKKTLMFKKGGGSSAPDPDPRIGQAALENAALGREWKAFAEKQFDANNQRQEEMDALTKRVGNQQLATQDQANQWAKEDRARYTDKFVPMEDEFIDKARDWDSDERQAQVAAEAKADVLSNAEQQRGATQRNMASMGIDPRSGRYAGVDRAAEQNTALAAAGAQNNSRKQVRKEGMAMEADAINMGRGLPSQAASGAALGLNAGNSAQGGALSNMSSARQNGAVMERGFQGAMSGNSSMMSGLNQQYGNQLKAWSTNRQAAAQETSGLMSGLGTVAGAAMMMSSKEFKEDRRPSKGSAVDTLKEMPVEEWKYREDGPGADGGQDHIGPYAEDFHKATGKGDGKMIPMQDMMGLQTKAIQELGLRMERLEGKGKKKPRRQPVTLDGEYEEKMA